ncbi:uncharacterized protein AB675_4763 [Cyphellophora attinorum]|uniref:Cupin type-1 domain-containing protein n=1 Tax=Cyphellophora attinorum TaxID=1664694 RepID=A0A0N0NI97_9EURO|nr:uncharacterized protein AB675_4763 [Phialophora attinorum]KPI35591.1 hypothetical protein AB675_4763 [Phialophora attinorum]
MPTKVETRGRWQEQKVVKRHDGMWVVEGHAPAIVLPGNGRFDQPSLFGGHTLPFLPTHLMITLSVKIPPAGATPPHYHGGAAVHATVIRGSVLNQTICPSEDPAGQGSGVLQYAPGESWFEPPGCHHVLSRNASDTDEAECVAVFVVEKKVVEELGLKGLVVIDAAVEDARL